MSKFKTLSIIALLLSISIVMSQPPLKKPLSKQINKEQTKEGHNEKKSAEDEHKHTISLDALINGNKNFQNNTHTNIDLNAQREETVNGQKPSFIVVTCSDSRVCPEIIFDKGLGEVFTIRTAGNVIDSVGLGSIEYAAEHLHSSYLIIMGHTKCGAVTAAISGETESPFINSILKYIFPAVQKAKSKNLDKDATLNFAITQNVKNQLDFVRKSKIIKHLEEAGELKIVACVYYLETGKVDFLN